jgi:hypothetical protein
MEQRQAGLLPITGHVSARNSRSSKPRKLTEWLVYRLGGAKAVHLGTVRAPNCETALALAYDEFEIAPAERRRIIVQRTSDHS